MDRFAMKPHCFQCCQNGTSCCEGTQIYLTTGDVLRIARFLNASNFFTFEVPDLIYTDPGDDPAWIALTVRPDGCRRAMKRTTGKNCTMLAENGCILPMTLRPLVCRLHPYTFTEAGISGVDPACPISHEDNWPVLLEQLGMAIGEARRWHQLLYCELHGDKTAACPEDFQESLPAVFRWR
jgi:hypothetical protein